MNFPTEKYTRKNFPIVDCGFEEATGLSWVTLATPEGRFTGTARVHPDDLEAQHYTRISGQALAHLRAYIDYLKYIKRLKQNSHKELLHLWAQSPKNNPVTSAIFDRILELHAEITRCEKSIDELKDCVTRKITALDDYYKHPAKVKNK